MLKKNLFILLILAAGVLTAAGQNNFDDEKYKPRTLAEIVEMNADLTTADFLKSKDSNPQSAFLVAYGNLLHSEVRVTFMNKSRPISAERKELLGIWQKSLQIDEKIISLYENEYLFKEDATEYWIPVQKQVAAYFPKELKEGDLISLYIVRVGGQRSKDGNNWDWLFLSTEFDKR